MNTPINNFAEIHKSLEVAFDAATVRAKTMMQFAHQRVDDAERATQQAFRAVQELELAADNLLGTLVNTPNGPRPRPQVDADALERKLGETVRGIREQVG